MKIIVTGIILIFFTFSGKAQEAFVVQGYLNRPKATLSINFQRNMFCYLKGEYIMPEYDSFCTFRVDSVLNGSFLNSNGEINKTPFYIEIGLINECTILDYGQNYTLRIKQFPHTNYYYIDSLNQVSSNDRYSDKLAEYHKNHQQNIDVLTKGTLQEKHDLFDKLRETGYPSQHTDRRYISYALPFMTNMDTIVNYVMLHWDGWDAEGRMAGGSEIIHEKGLYSDFLYDYLDKTLPFRLPDKKTTDSIDWHIWYNNLFSEKECFPFVKYARTENTTIIGKDERTSYISYFIPDTSKRKIYFASDKKSYILNITTDELTEFPLPQNRNIARANHLTYSIRNDEMPQYNYFDNAIDLAALNKGVFYIQDKTKIPLDLTYDRTSSSYRIYPNLIIHSDEDFLVFSSQNNYLKAGKINRSGKWVIEPKSLYRNSHGNPTDIETFSFCQSGENEITFVFSDKNYGRKSYDADKYGAIIIYKLNANLEVIDSVALTAEFSNFDNRFSNTCLLKNDKTYLLLVEVNGNQLYYKLLNDDLTSKTNFVKLIRRRDYSPIGKPIVTSDGFMISWVDNELSENVLRSVLIDKTGRQSNIISITNFEINGTFNMEFDENHVDIYFCPKDEGTLIRKRIDKSEYFY